MPLQPQPVMLDQPPELVLTCTSMSAVTVALGPAFLAFTIRPQVAVLPDTVMEGVTLKSFFVRAAALAYKDRHKARTSARGTIRLFSAWELSLPSFVIGLSVLSFTHITAQLSKR